MAKETLLAVARFRRSEVILRERDRLPKTARTAEECRRRRVAAAKQQIIGGPVFGWDRPRDGGQ